MTAAPPVRCPPVSDGLHINTDAFGANATQAGATPPPFGYTGQQADTNGLVYLRARYYDPNSGRFMSRDPFFGRVSDPLSLNRYTYVENGPVLTADPSGLAPAGPQDYRGADMSDLSGPTKSRALSQRDNDSPCTSNGGGALNGDVVYAGCTDPQAGGNVTVVIGTPWGNPIRITVPTPGNPFANRGGGGGKGQSTKDKIVAEKLTADQALSKYKRGSVRAEFPKQFLQYTLRQIEAMKKQKVPDADKAYKLLTDSRFDK